MTAVTIQDVIDQVDIIEPNAYSNAVKTNWLNECEGKVYTQLFLVQPYEFKTVSQSLALPAPYDRMYPRYLQAMIHYANGEYDRYANSMAAFNEVWAEANRWFGGDFDVTDRLRNRRVTFDIPAGVDYYSLIELPRGSALVAARMDVIVPVSHPYFVYTFLEPATATTYSFKINDTWYTFSTAGWPELDTGFLKGDTLSSNAGTVLNFYREGRYLGGITATEEHTGAVDLIDDCVAQLWVGDKSLSVGPPLSITERGRLAIPMIVADYEGETLGVTIGPGSGLTTEILQMKLTGHLLIPDEEWAYEDRYSRRRDARWRG